MRHNSASSHIMRLLQMVPTFPGDNSAHMTRRNVEHGSNLFRLLTTRRQCTDPANIVHRQFRLPMAFASGFAEVEKLGTPAPDHILRVVFGGAVVEVSRIATRRVVAVMARPKFGRAGTICQLSGDAMGSLSHLANTEPSVSKAIPRTHVWPTGILSARTIHALPESFDIHRRQAFLAALSQGLASTRTEYAATSGIRGYIKRLTTLWAGDGHTTDSRRSARFAKLRVSVWPVHSELQNRKLAFTAGAVLARLGVHSVPPDWVSRTRWFQPRGCFSLSQLYQISAPLWAF